MQASFESIVAGSHASFAYRAFKMRGFPFRWHFHPEYELTLIVSGEGRRFVGDHIGDFAAGDLVLLGRNLPHTWHSAPGRIFVGRHVRMPSASNLPTIFWGRRFSPGPSWPASVGC